MKLLWTVVVLQGLGAGAFVVFSLAPSSPAPSPPPAPPTAVVRQTVVREVVREAAPAAAVGVAPAASGAGDEPTERKETRQEQESRVQAELEMAFRQDTGPDAAASARQASLRGAFEANHVRPTSLECRRSTCRAELRFESADAAERALSQVFLGPGSDFGLATTVARRELTSDGSLRVDVYLHPDRPPVR